MVQCFSNFNIRASHMGILLKGGLWFRRSRAESELLHFHQVAGMHYILYNKGIDNTKIASICLPSK